MGSFSNQAPKTFSSRRDAEAQRKPHIFPALPVKTKNSVGQVTSVVRYPTSDVTKCGTCHPNKHQKVSSPRVGRNSPVSSTRAKDID